MPIKPDPKLIDKEQLVLKQQISFHQRQLKSAIRNLEARILLLLDENLQREGGRLVNTKTKLKQAQKLHKKLTILFEQEYGEAVKSFTKDFDKVAKSIESRFKEFDGAYAFTDVSKDYIAGLKAATMKELTAFGTMAREQVASSLYSAMIVGGKFNTLKSDIRRLLTGRYSKIGRPMTSYAGQMVFDQTMYFHNMLNLSEADRAGIDHFLYYGNIQNNTRSFCRRRVGKVYSRAEIERWTHTWDGKSGPPMSHRGGYNCRHSWVPVRKEWFKGKKEDK